MKCNRKVTVKTHPSRKGAPQRAFPCAGRQFARRGFNPVMATIVGLHRGDDNFLENRMAPLGSRLDEGAIGCRNPGTEPLLAPHVHVWQRIRVGYSSVSISQLLVESGCPWSARSRMHGVKEPIQVSILDETRHDQRKVEIRAGGGREALNLTS